MITNNYQRLFELKEMISNNDATEVEKKEYLDILYKNGNLTKEQIDSYTNDSRNDGLLKAALTIGAVLLTTWLISKMLEDK